MLELNVSPNTTTEICSYCRGEFVYNEEKFYCGACGKKIHGTFDCGSWNPMALKISAFTYRLGDWFCLSCLAGEL